MKPPASPIHLRDPRSLADRFDELRRAGRDDAALCVAHAARFLLEDETPPALRDYHLQYQPQRPRRVVKPLDNAAWLKWLQHPAEDPFVGKLFESVLAFVRQSRAQPLARFGLSPRMSVNPATSSVAVVRALAAAARALSAPLPLLYVHADEPGGLGHVPSEPIATVAGAGLTSGRGVGELAFVAGQHMALYRPDRYVHVLYPSTAELTIIVDAVIALGRGDSKPTPGADGVANELRARMKADPEALAHVRRVVELFLKQGHAPDIDAWIVGVQHTALRAGLVMCGDLSVARTLVAMLPDVPFDALDDLVDYVLSEEYAALRQHTGVALWPETRGDVPVPTSFDISLDELEAGRSDALRSVEIALDEIDPTRASALRSSDVRIDDVESQRAPVVDTGALHTIEIRIEPDGSAIDDSGNILAPAIGSAPRAAPASGHDATEFDIQIDDAHELEWVQRCEAAIAAREEGRAFAIASVVVHRMRERAPFAIASLVADHRARETFAEGVRLESGDWAAVRDPHEQGASGAFMEALDSVLALANPRAPEDYGFDRAHEAPAAVPLAAAIRWAARAIGAPVPLVFVAEEQARLLGRPACDPPIAVINPVLATTLTLAELAIVALEHVAYERPERRARVRLGDANALVRCGRAAHAFCTRGERPESGDVAAQRVVDVLARDPLRYAAVGRCAVQLKASELEESMTSWCLAAERSAARAAIAGVLDLDAAARAFALDRGNPARVPVAEKIAHLEAWIPTDEFVTVRRGR